MVALVMNGLDDPLTLMLLGLGTGILGNNKPGGNPFAGGMQGAMSGLMLGQQARTRRDEQATNRELKELQARKLQFEMDEAARQRADAQDWISKLVQPGQGQGGVAAPPPVGGAPATPGPDLMATGGPMVDYLVKNHGLPQIGAAGVVGNLYQESRFNPKAVHDNGTGYGMAGWRLDRRDKLQQFAQAQGRPVDDPNLQLDFLVNEMKSGDMGAQRAYAMLQQAKTPQEATTAMMHFFRPQDYTPANPQAGRGYQNRVQYTTQLAGGGMPGAGVPQGSDMPPADASGNALPPRQPQPQAPQQPRGFNLTTEMILRGATNKQLKPLVDTLMTLQNQDRTQANADRTYNFETGKWEYQKGQDVIKNAREAENAKVRGGQPNQALIDAEARAAAAQEEAKRKTALNFEASQKITESAVVRYEKDVRPPALAAQRDLDSLYEMKRLTASGIAAGPAIDARMLGARAMDWLGVRDMPEGMLNRTEFNNRAAQRVLNILQSKALGSGSGISSTDREFVEKMVAAGGNFTDKELQRIVDIGIKSADGTLKAHGDEVGRLRKLPGMANVDEGYFNITAPSYDEWSKANPAAVNAPAPPPAQGGEVPVVNSPAEAARLPRGTQFRTPDGRLKVVP